MSLVKIAATIAPDSYISEQEFNLIEKNLDEIDILEFRIDQWDHHIQELLYENLKVLSTLRKCPKLLVTYRTKSQGGNGTLSKEEYYKLIEAVSQINEIEMIDLEWDKSINRSLYTQLIHKLNVAHKQVILSHHNFDLTPEIEELKFIYYKMSQFEVEFLKLAVMPKTETDVLNLLQAMEMSSKTLKQHIIGISMGKIGVISRVAQEVFGGSVSYGCIDTPKAPGQIQIEELKRQLEFYHSVLET